jgi:predicted GNAT family acetyltransferase
VDTGAVVTDRPNSRLALDEEGQTAELVYRRNGRRFILVHTEVPKSLARRGIGGQLAEAAVECAASEG